MILKYKNDKFYRLLESKIAKYVHMDIWMILKYLS